MKFVIALASIQFINGLKNAHLQLSSVQCTPGVGPVCAEQCARNHCYAATNDGLLNSCLRQLDNECSVRVTGTLNVTLENNLDFCNIASGGFDPAGWLLNVPYLGQWARMYNPTVAVPLKEGSPLGAARCNYLANEMYYGTSPQAGIIDRTVCQNPVTSSSPTVVVPRDMRYQHSWVYPISVELDVNSMFLMPKYQQCWVPQDTLEFTVEFEHDLFGGHGVVVSKIVSTGTPSLTHI